MGRNKYERFGTFKDILDFTLRGRSPYKHGVPFRSFGRLHVDLKHTEITFSMGKDTICTVSNENILTFVATPEVIRRNQYTLSSSFRVFLPVHFLNFDVGRYKVSHEAGFSRCMHTFNDGATYEAVNWRDVRKSGQEYFQHLKIDLCTGKVINPKDTTPTVDEDRRRAWMKNLKAFRLRLRTMARIGVFDNAESAKTHGWWDEDDVHCLADAIMAQDVSPAVLQLLIDRARSYRYRRLSRGDAVMTVFESVIKTYSLSIRLHLKVLVVKE